MPCAFTVYPTRKTDAMTELPPSSLSRRMQEPLLWMGVALLSCLLRGSAIPVLKLSYAYFPFDRSHFPNLWAFAGLRFILAGIVAYTLAQTLGQRKGQRPRIKRGEGPVILCLGLLQTFGLYTFYYIALTQMTGVNASLFISSSSFMGVILAALFFVDDRLSLRKILAIVLGFTGLLLLTLRSGAELSFAFNPLGEGLLLVSAVISAFCDIYLRHFKPGSDVLLLTAYQFMTGGLLLTLLGFATGAKLAWPSWTGAFIFLYLALVSSLAIALWTFLLRHRPVSQLSIFKTLIPIFGALFSWLLLGDPLWRPQTLLGMLLVVLGIWTLNAPTKKDLPH